MGAIVVLAQQVAGICSQVIEPADFPGWPGHLDRLDAIDGSKAEMKPRVGGRLVAPAADPPAEEAPATGVDVDPGPDGVPIRWVPSSRKSRASGLPRSGCGK